MKIKDQIKAQLVIWKVALDAGKTPAEVKRDMQEALDIAWRGAWEPGNLQAQVEWQRRFLGGRKPSLETFLIELGKQLRSS